MTKLVVYTCISGGYDNLISHKYTNPDCEYVCFTDNKKLVSRGKAGQWNIRPMVFSETDPVRNARWHKTHPHVLFRDYEQSLWIDASIDVMGPQIFNAWKKSRQLIMTVKHSDRDCIYPEFDACLDWGKDSPEAINKTRQFILSQQMPTGYGLAETGIMFRRHHQPRVVKIDEQWWDMIKSYSRRDQLSFTYVLWKNKVKTKDIATLRPNRKWYSVNYSHNKIRGALEHFGIKELWNGDRRLEIFGKKLLSWTPRYVKKDLLFRYKKGFNWAGYSVNREADGIHIRGNGLHIVGRADNTLWTADGVLMGRDYDLDMGRGDWTVIDIGANIGITLLYFARRAAVKTVYGFEPFAPTMAQARKNMALNPELAKKIKLFAFGLSDHDETLSLPYNQNFPGAQSSIKAKQLKKAAGEVCEKIKLRRASDVLHPILAREKTRKIMMKIDCEGAEREIIPNLAQAGLLGHINNIIMEWHDGYYRPLVKILKQNGFSVKATTNNHDSSIGMIKAENIGKIL